MKFSNYYSQCGVIDHPITKLIDKLKKGDNHEAVVVCLTDEVFDEAMTTITNRFKQAVGVKTLPNPGAVMGTRVADISIYIEVLNVTVKLKVMTKAEYEADKTAVDALGLPIKEITYSGGQI